MAYDETVVRRIRRALGARRGFTERKMFGGVAFLLRGRMCCGVLGDELVVRVPEPELAAVLRQRHVRPMDFTGKPLKGFVYVAPAGFRTLAALRGWLARGERFVRQAYPEPGRRKPVRRSSAGAT